MAIVGNNIDDRSPVNPDSSGNFPGNFDNVVAVDTPDVVNAYIGRNVLPGSGYLIGDNHALTAEHVISGNPNARVTHSSDVPGLPQRSNPSTPVPSADLNTTNILAFAPDMSLLTTASDLTAGSNLLGLISFYDLNDADGLPIATAGYPEDAQSNVIDVTARTMVTSAGDIANIGGSRIFYSDTVDTQSGQSGSGVWIEKDDLPANTLLSDVQDDLVLAIHTGVTNGVNRGEVITPAIYKQITDQMESDAGSAADARTEAAQLPENVIVGSGFTGIGPAPAGNDDFITGSYRKEFILGQSGDDSLLGGSSDDRLDGGTGVDQALFSDLITNYDITITDSNPANPAFEFNHAQGTQTDARDSVKNTEFAVFEFVDSDNDNADDDGNIFLVPLQVDPNDPTKLKDGPEINYENDIPDANNGVIGKISAQVPAFMFDGDVEYTLTIGSEQNILYNFAYIVDSSGSMAGTPLADTKAAYETLTNFLINEGVAASSRFAVVDFDTTATLFPNLDAQDVITTVNSLPAGGLTNFADALQKAEDWYESVGTSPATTNIAFFLSDGINTTGPGANANLQVVNEGTPDEATVDVRAFGLLPNAQLGPLNIIDSNTAVLLNSSADLIDAFSVSGISRDAIDRIDVRLAGAVIDTIDPANLIDAPLGLSFEGTIDNLLVTRTAENDVQFDLVFNDGTPTANLNAKITTGQQEVRQQSADGTQVVVTFSVDQTAYGGTDESEEINANDLDNEIDGGGGLNEIKGNGGDDRFIISGGTNVIDGGDGIDTAVFSQTLADAGGISKIGDVVSVGTDHSFVNVEFIEFLDTRISTDLLNPAPVVSIVPNDLTISESDAGLVTADFTVTLSEPSNQPIEVFFSTQDDTATASEDYADTTGSIIIPDGQTSGTVSIAINQDALVEGPEAFLVQFSIGDGATFSDGATETVRSVQIEDDDATIGFSFIAFNLNQDEGDPGSPTTYSLTIERSGNLSGEDVVSFAVDGFGANPAQASDFVGGFPTGTITFAAGESTQTIDIQVSPDLDPEADESFSISLASVSGSATVPSDALVLTIADDDGGIIGPGPQFSYSLVDTDADTTIAPIVDGQTTGPNGVPPGERSITAQFVGDDADSVASLALQLFDENGTLIQARTETAAPYTLYGDIGGDFFDPTSPLANGDYSLTVTAFNDVGNGEVIGTETIQFTIGGPVGPTDPEFTFTLVDAQADIDIAAILDGETTDPDGVNPSNRTISAQYDGARADEVGSLRISLFDEDGSLLQTRTEMSAPYALFGDAGGDFFLPGFPLDDGIYSLEATAFTGTRGDGETIATELVDFTIGDENGTTTRTVTTKVLIDGEQRGTGTVDTTNVGRDNDLEIGQGDTAGLLFKDVPIPTGASILDATIMATSQRDQSQDTDIDIKLFDDAKIDTLAGPGALTDPGFDTFGANSWNVTTPWTAGEKVTTPDLSDLVEDLLATDPQADNSYDLLFSLGSSNGIRRIKPEEAGPDDEAELIITYMIDDPLIG